MTDALLLLAFTAFVCGYVMRDPLREHFTDLAKKLAQDINTLIEMLVDIAGQVYILMLTVYAIVMMAIFATIEFSTEFWQKVVRPYLLAIRRFLWKWWWVYVAAVAIYFSILIFWFITEPISFNLSDVWMFLAFLVAVVIVFAVVHRLFRFAKALIWALVAILIVFVSLVAIGVVSLGLYGIPIMAILFGALIGAMLVMLASATKAVIFVLLAATVVLLSSLIPNFGDGVAIKIPQMSTEQPLLSQVVTPSTSSFTVVAEAVARPGDGCITMLEQLGITKENASSELGTDRLSWCVTNAQKVGRLTYWHSDSKRWVAPRVCLNEVKGKKGTQPEHWTRVSINGTTKIRMPPDSRTCTKP